MVASNRLDLDYPLSCDIDVAEDVPNFKSIARIGLRGAGCYIRDIRLRDPNGAMFPYQIAVDINQHLMDQGWASNNPRGSFGFKKLDDGFTYIFIKGQEASDSSDTSSTDDSNTDDTDKSSNSGGSTYSDNGCCRL